MHCLTKLKRAVGPSIFCSRAKATAEILVADGSLQKQQPAPWRPDNETSNRARKTLERILTDNILPFWQRDIIDKRNGGYRLNHDLKGRWRGPANKCLVTQARTVWFFSRLVRSRYGTREHLQAASHGYAFLREQMRDKDFGGFYWELDESGHSATRPEKQMYGQAFALYALTEYASASGDASATAAAQEVFELLETKAHDKRYGGYHDILQRDWSSLPAPAGGRTNHVSVVKRMNTHLHLLEAFTTFTALTNESVARERLIELIFVNSNSVVRKDVGACTDKFLENWQPVRGSNFDRVSYGHDVENISLLMKACKVAGVPASLLSDLYRTLFSYALRHGFDQTDGGFYQSGPLNAPADRREKTWWVQAEGLVAALQLYRFTGEELYWNCFWRTLQWIDNYQADWEHGDWYETIEPNGKASGIKAGPWKCPYHHGRAVLHCLDLLDARDDNASRFKDCLRPSLQGEGAFGLRIE